ncbi:uncharacterized protein [Diadema setosum]|uniref:uncharacterized protein n=1 Tax=Diadema setosum TaxID=31175 RepID=UPI003B3A7887
MRLHLYVLPVLLVVIGAMVMTSSATRGRCTRRVTRYRQVCATARQSYRHSYTAWCPFRKIYYRSFRTSYRTITTSNCRRQSYQDTEDYCCRGYAGNGQMCTDINECTTGDHYCFNGATCNNTEGGYECVCSAAHTGIYCADDVDECATGIHDCFSGPHCRNLDGSFTCSCPPGYTDQQPSNPGRNCADNNECTLATHDCFNNASCINIPGSFNCSCPTGYREGNPGNPGRTCSDIDECAERTSECQNDSQCVNTDGDYDCVCLRGYTGSRCEEEVNILA